MWNICTWSTFTSKYMNDIQNYVMHVFQLLVFPISNHAKFCLILTKKKEKSYKWYILFSWKKNHFQNYSKTKILFLKVRHNWSLLQSMRFCVWPNLTSLIKTCVIHTTGLYLFLFPFKLKLIMIFTDFFISYSLNTSHHLKIKRLLYLIC